MQEDLKESQVWQEMKDQEVKIGVLAIQGSFAEHIHAFKQLKNVQAIEIKTAQDLKEDIQGLVIPGGESTTMGHFLQKDNFLQHIKAWSVNKFLWGTCAGLILLADLVNNEKDGGQCKIGGLSITVSRNSYGRQKESFEQKIHVKLKEQQEEDHYGVFIRAPKIEAINQEIQILAQKASNKEIVGVKQGRIMATSFHPELTNDLRFHQFFLNMITQDK